MAISGARDILANQGRPLGRWLGLRGLITLAFGLLFLLHPVAGVGILVALFAVYCIFDGILALTAAISGAALGSRALLAAEGILSLVAGVLAYAIPGDVAIAILFLIAARALVVGAFEIVAALRLGHAIANPWMVAFAGVLSIAFGLMLLHRPVGGLLALAWLVGIYGLVLGAAQIVAAFTLRGVARRPLRGAIAQH